MCFSRPTALFLFSEGAGLTRKHLPEPVLSPSHKCLLWASVVPVEVIKRWWGGRSHRPWPTVGRWSAGLKNTITHCETGEGTSNADQRLFLVLVLGCVPSVCWVTWEMASIAMHCMPLLLQQLQKLISCFGVSVTERGCLRSQLTGNYSRGRIDPADSDRTPRAVQWMEARPCMQFSG